MELVDALEVLGLGDQQQLGVAARADEREALQQVPVGEVLAGGDELALVLLAPLAVQPPPGRVDLQERVLDEMPAAHGVDYRIRRGAPPLVRIQLPRADRAALAVLVDVSGRCHAPHRGARRGAPTAGHEPRILAPFDPDDAISRRLHRGARPQRHPVPEGFVSLGRTVGLPANGAVSNIAISPSRDQPLRRELRGGGYDVVHIHEPVVPVVSWDALCSAGELPLVGTFHTYSENTLTNGFAAVPLGGRRRMNRLHVRIAVSEAAAWTARRFFGGRYRIVPNGVHLQPATGAEGAVEGERRPGELRILFIGQAVERKGLPVLLRPSRRCASTCRRRCAWSGRPPRRSRT